MAAAVWLQSSTSSWIIPRTLQQSEQYVGNTAHIARRSTGTEFRAADRSARHLEMSLVRPPLQTPGRSQLYWLSLIYTGDLQPPNSDSSKHISSSQPSSPSKRDNPL